VQNYFLSCSILALAASLYTYSIGPSIACCGSGWERHNDTGSGSSTSEPTLDAGGTFEPFTLWQKVQLAASGLVHPATARAAVVWYSYKPQDVAGTDLTQWNIAKEVARGRFELVPREESLRVASALGRGESVDPKYRVLTPEHVEGPIPTALISWPES
jgi:hypothetical protein